MDPFEVRMQFLTLLRRLNASQQSIQKVVGFAVKYFPPCGEDLWDCIVEECQKGSINARINILYFLDSLCEACLLVKSHSNSIGPDRDAKSSHTRLYVDYVARDIGKIVDSVVPVGRQGLPNLVSTKQILESWRSKRVIEPHKLDEVISALNDRTDTNNGSSTAQPLTSDALLLQQSTLSRTDVFKRIEEDRERHKRLRERRWVQPISSHHSSSAQLSAATLASFLPMVDAAEGEEELAIDIEFENEWEATSDWNEDDVEAVAEECDLCFPAEGEGPMDLS
ncbi:hypothetical protein AMATHDRAFT_152115 [Amanita thiersii Skay4041]|uniref:CID domain-containing protein n=1 Tax=Amanita thiersii Skay4041 TaxID=703135 RepID=A0A2A9NI76_9AGAR|nr:hypothetical protein AMATHDRAFT_152115 [Amanita thiersii Skay4041]